jgi:hypothetical protein
LRSAVTRGQSEGVEKPRIVRLHVGLEILAYEGPAGLRVDSWKSFRVEGNVLIEKQQQQPSQELAALRFATVDALKPAVLRELRRS